MFSGHRRLPRARRRCAEMPSLPDPTPLQFWAGPGRHLLHYAIDGGRTVNFLAVVRVPEWTERGVDGGVRRSATPSTRFAGWHPAVTEMVGATDVGARWALHDLAPLAPLAHRAASC